VISIFHHEWVPLSADVTFITLGDVVSIVNVFTLNGVLAFPSASVTVIVQSLYVHVANVLKVIVLSHEIAAVVAQLQLPP